MKAYVALGSNLGDRLDNLAEALRRIDETEHAEVHAVSQVYESEPWGVAGQPPFANAVAVIDTSMRADDLLVVLKEIERGMGRETSVRNGPRVIDLDIVLFGDEEWDTDELVIPHPRMVERDFVVTPLLEVDPEVRMPDGTPITHDGATLGPVTGSLGMIPGFEDRVPASSIVVDSGAPDVVLDSAEQPVPLRRPLPDEEWVPAWERTVEPASIMSMPRNPLSGGLTPDVDAGFCVLILDQLGIPHAWDPFEPGMGSDPYGFVRPFKLLVPASMAAEARRSIEEAVSAPWSWDDIE